VPQHDDRTLFEFLLLEGAQAGLSWLTILKRKDSYAQAFHRYDIERIAAYGEADTVRLLADEGIIRNRAKVASAIRNAKATLELQREFGSFDAYLWSFVGGAPKRNAIEAMSQIPSESDESKALSRDLKQHDFNFVGPTICYAFMQAIGMANDHLTGCFRYNQV